MASISVKNVTVEFPLIDHERRFMRYEIITRAFRPFASLASSFPLTASVGARIERAQNRINVLALDNVSIELEAGDRLGIIGPNGSGKSTLLRTLAGIYHPVRGSVTIEGRPTTLFSLTQGMDPEATGMDNIHLRAKFLDIPKARVREKIDEIIEFCELGEFLLLPVRTYSPGMMARLAFSITTIEEPDILILDEILGAGDAKFMVKAQARIREYVARAGLMVLATHSDAIIREWCNKGIFLNRGKVEAIGAIDDVMQTYHEYIGQAA